MSEKKLRAVFGGTFDPIHLGHLQVAREVRDQLRVDDFRFLPAGDPPHRDHVATARQRLEMLQLALANQPHMRIDEREMNRDGPSWMSVTLESLREEYPDDALLLLLGQDAANGLDQWHEWHRIPELAHLVIMSRPERMPEYSDELRSTLDERTVTETHDLRKSCRGLVYYATVSPLIISSTYIRAEASNAEALLRWVPRPVASYIVEHGLYR